MKTVIIFGGSGFVGKNIIRHLARTGYRIIVPYQQLTNETRLKLYGDVGQIIPVKFNELTDEKIINLINDTNAILNLKTIWQENKIYSYQKHILNFNKQLVDLISKTNNKKTFIFFSGLGVSEKSSSERTQCIVKTEQYIIQNLTNVSIIRPGVIIGYDDQFLRKLLLIFKLSFFIPLFGSGKAKLQPVFVDDVAKAIRKILELDIKGQNIYELAGPEIFTYKTLYQYIAKCLNVRRVFVPVPFGFARKVILLIEKTPFKLITIDQLLLFKEDNIVSNLHKNFADLGLFSRDVREVIREKLL